MVGEELLRFKKNQKLLCFDFETMHLNLLMENHPWQLAFIVADQNRVYEEHNYYINWGRDILERISKGAAIATGFDLNKVLREGRDPKEIYSIFSNYIDSNDYLIIGHNLINFDVYVDKIWAEAIGQKHRGWDYLNRLIDTNCLAKAIKKNIPPDKENFLAWQYKMSNMVEKGLKTNLGLCAREHGLNVDQGRLHAAEYDIGLNYQIFKKQLWQIEI